MTGGELDTRTYWEARAAIETVEHALATEQPSNAIAAYVPRALERFDAVLAEYPNHAEVQAWRARTAALPRDVDPAFDTKWSRGFHWGHRPFVEGWVAFKQRRFLAAVTAWERCFDVHAWSEDARRLLREGIAEARRLSRDHPLG